MSFFILHIYYTIFFIKNQLSADFAFLCVFFSLGHRLFVLLIAYNLYIHYDCSYNPSIHQRLAKNNEEVGVLLYEIFVYSYIIFTYSPLAEAQGFEPWGRY